MRRPVEGTILTVLREMAEAAEAAPDDLDPKTLMDVVVSAGWKSVEKTPSMLKVLADAGVVDAGGYGLVVLIEGAVNGGSEWEVPISGRIGDSLSVALAKRRRQKKKTASSLLLQLPSDR